MGLIDKRFNSRFLWKLFGLSALLIVLTALITGFQVSWSLQAYERDATEQRLRGYATVMAGFLEDSVAGKYSPAFQERIGRIGGEMGARLTVIRADGEVIADSSEDPEKMDNHARRPEIVEAQRRGFGSSSRFSNTIKKDMVYYALSIRHEGQILGYARTSVPVTDLKRLLAPIHGSIAKGATLGAFLSLLVSLVYVRQIVHPLTRMTRLAYSIAGGNYDRRVPVQSKDEVGELATSLNRMADQIEKDVARRIQAEDVLHKAHEELEDRVKERTLALAQANEDLKSEIAERKRAEEIKTKLEKQLLQAQKMEAIGTLAGGIAHDFNNILGSVIGYSELAIRALPEEHRAAAYVRQILSSGDRAKRLVKQILTFSRRQESRQESHREPVVIQSVVEEAVDLLRAALPSTIEIRQKIDPDIPFVMADSTQMHQIVVNLGTNALHAMNESGGILEILVKSFQVDAYMAQTHSDLREGLYLRLTVSDTGHGMDRSTMERVFEPFFTTKDTGKGTGLGLALVHGIVRNHGGSISVYSEPGKGAVFHIYLPAFREIEISAEILEEPEIFGQEEHVLLVDDEISLAEVGKQTLESLGYRVTVSTDPAKALEIFRMAPQSFDLVVTDQTMPQMVGTRLAREMLAIRPDLPIVLTTGFSHQVNEESAKKLGIREYLLKPITGKTLGETIRRALGKDKDKTVCIRGNA